METCVNLQMAVAINIPGPNASAIAVKESSDPEQNIYSSPALDLRSNETTPLTELSRSNRLQKYFGVFSMPPSAYVFISVPLLIRAGVEVDNDEVTVRDLFNNNQRKDVKLRRCKSHSPSSTHKNQKLARARSVDDEEKKENKSKIQGVFWWLNNASSPKSSKKARAFALRSPAAGALLTLRLRCALPSGSTQRMSGREFSSDDVVTTPNCELEMATPSKLQDPELSLASTVSSSCISSSISQERSNSNPRKKRRLFRFK